MKISSVATELFYADGQRDRHDEANSRFTQFCELIKKTIARKCYQFKLIMAH